MIQVRSVRAGLNLWPWDGAGRCRHGGLCSLGWSPLPPARPFGLLGPAGARPVSSWAGGARSKPSCGLQACSRCLQQRERGQGRFTALSPSHCLSVPGPTLASTGRDRNGE